MRMYTLAVILLAVGMAVVLFVLGTVMLRASW